MTTIEVKTREDIKLNVRPIKFVKGDYYAMVDSYYRGNKRYHLVSYWTIAKENAIQLASNCSSERGVISKIAKFLNL